jgi:hypothetical protein
MARTSRKPTSSRRAASTAAPGAPAGNPLAGHRVDRSSRRGAQRRALYRTRTDDPFLTIEGLGGHRVPHRPGRPMKAGHEGLDGTGGTLGRAPETPQKL